MENKKPGKETEDAKNSLLISLIMEISDWFASHPQAAQDCRKHVNRKELFEEEMLDEIFGKEINIDNNSADDDEGLPAEVTIWLEGIENWDDNDEVSYAIDEHLSNTYGFLVRGYNWEVLTDRENKPFAVNVTNIEWEVD